MSNDFKDLMHLYSCGIYNKMPAVKDYNIENILLTAKKHEILQTVFLSVKKLYKEGKSGLTNEQFNALNMRFTTDIAINIKKTQSAYYAINRLEESGIKCCLLKGDSIARFYALPQTRISSDIDVLIDEKDEEKSIEILKNLNFTIKEKSPNEHHYKAYSPDNALLEVHTLLYSKTTENIIFGGKINYSDKYTKINLANDVTLCTLNTFDNALFLTAHLLKHFINSGVGLRQISDLLIFANNFKDQIDFEKYFGTLKELKFDKLILTVFKIGNTYFDTDLPIPFDADDALIDKLLDDIENGGVFGNKNVRSSSLYFKIADLRTNSLNKQYKWKKPSLIRRFFPSMQKLKVHYPVLKKYPVMLPVVHIIRVFKFVFRIERKNELNDKVFSLFKDFDIV